MNIKPAKLVKRQNGEPLALVLRQNTTRSELVGVCLLVDIADSTGTANPGVIGRVIAKAPFVKNALFNWVLMEVGFCESRDSAEGTDISMAAYRDLVSNGHQMTGAAFDAMYTRPLARKLAGAASHFIPEKTPFKYFIKKGMERLFEDALKQQGPRARGR